MRAFRFYSGFGLVQGFRGYARVSVSFWFHSGLGLVQGFQGYAANGGERRYGVNWRPWGGIMGEVRLYWTFRRCQHGVVVV